MPSSEPPRSGRRTWNWLVGIVAILFLLLMAFGMWSEREDAQRIPDDVEQRQEETWQPEPVDSPAVP